MRQLNTIRKDIAKITADLAKLNATLPPQDELISSLRYQLGRASEKWQKASEAAAKALANGETVEMFASYHIEDKADMALGLAVLAYGIDAVLADVLANSQKYTNPNTVRMPLTEKNKNLAELRVALYTLSLEEEAALNGEVRREEMHPAAVLGIPLDVLQKHPKYTFATS